MNKFTLLAAALATSVFASAPAHANIVADPSFELGDAGSSPWAQASSNFGTPLCTVALCGTGNGTGPRTGDWWAWFGGAANLETSSASQTITLLDGASTLSFWFENTIAGSTQDFIEARVGGTTVWRYNAGGALSGLGGYSQITVDLSSFGAGPQQLEFFSVSGNSVATNFFIDGAPLTGQSDNVANLQLGFENIDSLSQQTLLLTYVSDRVTSRGAAGLPDIFESPGLTVDFVLRQGLNLFGRDLEMKLEARNIFGRGYREFQERGGNRVFYNRYDIGTSFSASVSTSF